MVLTNNATPLAQLFSDLFYPKSFIRERERMQKCHVCGFEDLLFSVFREFERDICSAVQYSLSFTFSHHTITFAELVDFPRLGFGLGLGSGTFAFEPTKTTGLYSFHNTCDPQNSKSFTWAAASPRNPHNHMDLLACVFSLPRFLAVANNLCSIQLLQTITKWMMNFQIVLLISFVLEEVYKQTTSDYAYFQF
ncbi:hypothetical protein NC653_014148 [Populus alba x Populus x berolinensis]|uniref:Uncharacterized protein n=1 Tax=Populus alba x Populus x berolinensis TaxID=444605 RepID=A0AAD6QWB9_9ROSI|nr:hypothetical protein NC653_014148 [Populus alba x Populus x berolinensis]